MQIDPKYAAADPPRRLGAAAPADGPAGHDDRARPRHRAAARSPRATRSRSPTGAERQPRPDPRLARRRHPRLPAAAARRRRAGARRHAARASFAQVLRRFEPDRRATSRRSTARSRSAATNIRHVITNFKLIAEELGQVDTHLTEFVDSAEPGLRRVRRPGGEAPRDASASCRAPCTRPAAPSSRRDRSPASSARRSTDLIPAGPGARPGAAGAAAVLPQDRADRSATQLRPFTQQVATVVGDIRRAAKPLAQSTTSSQRRLHGAQPARQRPCLQPARQRRGLPLLPELAEPQHQRRDAHPGRSRPGSARAVHLHLHDVVPRRQRRVAAPSIGTARDLVRLPTTDEICPDLFPVKGEGSAEGPSGDSSTTTTTDETTDETTSTTTTTDETTSTDTTTPDGSAVDPTTAEPGSATETTTTDGAP